MEHKNAGKVSIFTSEKVSLQELIDMYGLDSVEVPSHRPYIWSQTVTSFEGVMSILESNRTGPEEVAMKHIPESGSESDFRVLQCGWMYADAILISSTILENEPNATLDLVYDDLIQYRTQVLQKPNQALKVIVTTRTLDVQKHNIWKLKGEKLIITTEESMRQTLSSNPADLLQKYNVNFATFPLTNGKIPVVDIVSYLKLKKGVNFLEISSGPQIMNQFFKHTLIDETRLTKAGILYGFLSSEGISRPIFGNAVQFVGDTSPLLEYIGIRLYGKHHLFLRGKWTYRHLNK